LTSQILFKIEILLIGRNSILSKHLQDHMVNIGVISEIYYFAHSEKLKGTFCS